MGSEEDNKDKEENENTHMKNINEAEGRGAADRAPSAGAPEKAGGDASEAKDEGAGADEPESRKIDGDKVAFETLNSIEKESLIKKLNKQILKTQQPDQFFCLSFISWLFEQFSCSIIATAPATLFANIDFLGKRCHTRQLFVDEGSAESVRLYYDCIGSGVEQDYNADDLDISSLAAATRRYIKENVVFIKRDIYAQLCEDGEDRGAWAGIVERLPFVVSNRSVLVALREIIDKLDKSKVDSQVDRSKSVDVWKDAVIKPQSPGDNDSLNDEQKKEIFKELLDAEFDYVPMDLFQ